MYVCLCNGLTDRHVRDACAAGACRPSDVYRACGTAAQCGSCVRTVRGLLDDFARSFTPANDVVLADAAD
jgi:bacterioferritin-associated ferredoxin